MPWFEAQFTLAHFALLLAGLALVIGFIALTASKSAHSPRLDQAEAPAPPADEPDPQDDSELIAVITAAVMAMLEQEQALDEALPPDSFIVRSIRRVHNAPAWNRAGREEQIYSRI